MKKGIRQHDLRDCGAACLATICYNYGVKIPLVKARELMKVDRNGSTLLAMSEAAQTLGLQATSLCGTWEELSVEIQNKKISTPFVAHMLIDGNLAHYVVVQKIESDKIKVFDPGKGKCTYTQEAFRASWTGYIVLFQESEQFEKVNLKKGFFSRYWILLNNQKKLLSVIFLFSVAMAGISIIGALLHQTIIDQYVLGANRNSLILLSDSVLGQLQIMIDNIAYLFLAMLGLYVFQGITFFVRGVLFAKVSKKISEELTDAWFRHLLEVPMSFFQDRDSGEILSRFQNIAEVREVISSGTLTVIMSAMMAVAGAGILIYIQRELFLLVLIVVVAYAIVVFAYRKALKQTSQAIMEGEAKVTNVVKESIDGMETIKAFHGERRYYEKFNNKIGKLLKLGYKIEILGSSQEGLLVGIQEIGALFVLWIGSMMVLEGEISLGALISFIALMSFFVSPIQSLVGLQPEFQLAVMAMERLNDVFEISKENEVHKGTETPNSLNEKISFENVSFRYGYRQKILKDIQLCINEGENVAIIGESGCGKTTLVKLLQAFYSPLCGKVKIGDMEIQDISLTTLRENIAYVSQETMLFTGTVRDNLLLGVNKVSKTELEQVIVGCKLENVISNLSGGMEYILDGQGSTLSGGQKQRIAIARAILRKPDILILDEATSQMDIKTEEEILKFIKIYCKEATCIFIQHKISDFKYYHQIIEMREGNIIDIHRNYYGIN